VTQALGLAAAGQQRQQQRAGEEALRCSRCQHHSSSRASSLQLPQGWGGSSSISSSNLQLVRSSHWVVMIRCDANYIVLTLQALLQALLMSFFFVYSRDVKLQVKQVCSFQASISWFIVIDTDSTDPGHQVKASCTAAAHLNAKLSLFTHLLRGFNASLLDGFAFPNRFMSCTATGSLQRGAVVSSTFAAAVHVHIVVTPQCARLLAVSLA
jgi:hypothetical protein